MSCEVKLKAFSRLRGWNYTDGLVFSEDTIAASRQLLDKITNGGFYRTDAFPGLNGEVMLVVYLDADTLEFIIEPTLTVTFTRETANSEKSQSMTLAEALMKIKDLLREENDTVA